MLLRLLLLLAVGILLARVFRFLGRLFGIANIIHSNTVKGVRVSIFAIKYCIGF